MRRALIFAACLTAGCGGAGGIGAISCGETARVGAARSNAATVPSSIIEPYLKIHDALADDRLDAVQQNAGAIATAAASLGAAAAPIDTAAVQLASAGDLNAARDRYGVLSDAIVAYMKGSKIAPPDGVRTAYCPMVRRPWLQKGDTIANPYFGKAMSTCGDFR
jgi:hypothetical protein